MKTRRSFKTFGLALLALTAAAAVMVGSSTAAKIPKYHVYKQCTDSVNCTAAAYLNSSQRSIVTFTASPKCTSVAGFAFSIENEKTIRVSKKTGKFKFTDTVFIQAKDGGSEKAVVTVNGKVKRKKKVTASYSVDITPSNCPETKTGKFSMKYKGTQTGG